jgi:Putative Flp pilus-assembly TadE/G-like
MPVLSRNHSQSRRPGRTVRLLGKTKRSYARGENAQALVIVALVFFTLLAFVGLLTDVGSVYVTYSRLKNAVDSAAVAAANNIKYPQATPEERRIKITEAAREVLALEHVTDITTLIVYLCPDSDKPDEFTEICPGEDEPPRKLAWVQATEAVPVYFLRLFGVESINMTTSAVGEAATVDLVLVFDTSESMGKDTPGYDPNNFDPGTCNSLNNCMPLYQAKTAAKSMVSKLFEGYDQVAIVTFDTKANTRFALGQNLGDDDGAYDGDVYDAIDHMVILHDDAPSAKLDWYASYRFLGFNHPMNPIWPDDRDGDGQDADPLLPCTDVAPRDLYDDSNPSQPCDDPTKDDAYDWQGDGNHENDACPTGKICPDYMSLLSTCTGCGIRQATNILGEYGRPNGVWVIVFLSDGIANLSDTHSTNGNVPEDFKYGYCGDSADENSWWSSFCIDTVPNTRYCIDANSNTCPPDTPHTNTSRPYSVEDYAYDMVDDAALLMSTNEDEPLGQNIIMYAVGLGAASNGEAILRYMANVGDEGSRNNDACAPGGVPMPPQTNCGNYYYAPTGAYLNQIFESIATRIFTKISH